MKTDSAIVGKLTNHEFTGLEEGGDYSYVVSGHNGSVYSLPSNRISVKLLNTLGIESAQSDKAGIEDKRPLYNTNGQRIGRYFRGIVIQRGKKFIKR